MTNKLLGIIAINLTILTGLMVLQSIPTATAHTGENDWYSEQYDYTFQGVVESIVDSRINSKLSSCSIDGDPDWGYDLSCY